MNYEKGLVRLQQQLRKWGDGESVRQTANLEVQLWDLLKRWKSNIDDPNFSRELTRVVDDLNKIAYRTSGTSFVWLCSHPRANLPNSILFLSLRGVLLFVSLALFLPVVSVALASTGSRMNSQRQIEQIQQEIQLIDERIGLALTSPFYLSEIPPCSDNPSFEFLRSTDETLSLTRLIVIGECIWEYEDIETGQVIAKEYWQWPNAPALQKREYFRGSLIIARDSFSFQSDNCFKRRSYLNDQGQPFFEECFTEAGIPDDQGAADDMLSPIPPMVYWFFSSVYR